MERSGGVCEVRPESRGMEGEVLNLIKPLGSSLLPLHMTRLFFLESISSSTLARLDAGQGSGERRKKGAGEAGPQNVARS